MNNLGVLLLLVFVVCFFVCVCLFCLSATRSWELENPSLMQTPMLIVIKSPGAEDTSWAVSRSRTGIWGCEPTQNIHSDISGTNWLALQGWQTLKTKVAWLGCLTRTPLPSADVSVAACVFLASFVFFLGSSGLNFKFVLSIFSWKQVCSASSRPHDPHSPRPSPTLLVGVRLEKLFSSLPGKNFY